MKTFARILPLFILFAAVKFMVRTTPKVVKKSAHVVHFIVK